MWKFLKRSLETFGRLHALEVNLGRNSGVQIINDDEGKLLIIHFYKLLYSDKLQLICERETVLMMSDGVSVEGRGIIKKKKYKWLIILPLIILMKIAHLKMKVVTLLLGVLGLNTLILGGTAWIIHYLKFKTLCKIHPHYVQHHTHSFDYDVAGKYKIYLVFLFEKSSVFPIHPYHLFSNLLSSNYDDFYQLHSISFTFH